jgi:hypothetical protein
VGKFVGRNSPVATSGRRGLVLPFERVVPFREWEAYPMKSLSLGVLGVLLLTVFAGIVRSAQSTHDADARDSQPMMRMLASLSASKASGMKLTNTGTRMR